MTLSASDRLHEAITQGILEEAMRQERDLVKLVAPSHSCDSNWAGTHCVVCSEAQAVAVRVAKMYNRSMLELQTEIERHHRDFQRISLILTGRSLYATLTAAEQEIRNIVG